MKNAHETTESNLHSRVIVEEGKDGMKPVVQPPTTSLNKIHQSSARSFPVPIHDSVNIRNTILSVPEKLVFSDKRSHPNAEPLSYAASPTPAMKRYKGHAEHAVPSIVMPANPAVNLPFSTSSTMATLPSSTMAPLHILLDMSDTRIVPTITETTNIPVVYPGKTPLRIARMTGTSCW